MSNLPIPPLVPILVGINKYSNYRHLRTSATDADKLGTFLRNEFPVKGDIKIIKDEEATRVKILDTLSSLQADFERDNAILFFFSGYHGKLRSTPNPGIICSTEFGKETPGITDEALVQLFDSIARARGNNIVSNPNP
jgi:hypothetical protein